MSIKEILQHRHGLGLTRAQTATAVGVSTGTVSHILERASAAGLSWPLPDVSGHYEPWLRYRAQCGGGSW